MIGREGRSVIMRKIQTFFSKLRKTQGKSKHSLRTVILEKSQKFLRGKNVRRWKENLISGINKGHDQRNVMTFLELLGSMIAAASCGVAGPAIAEYKGEGMLYYISKFAIVITSVMMIWFLICIVGYERLHGLGEGIRKAKQKLTGYIHGSKWGKPSIYIAAFVIIFTLYNWHGTSYYSSVAEVYGIPVGVGEPLSYSVRKERSGYWRIKDYSFRKCIEVTYEEPYHQMKLMSEYSTAYNMSFFQPSARVVYKYEKDKSKFRDYGQEFYITARKNKFRTPKEVRYYGDDGKLLLKQKKTKNDLMEIAFYSSDDMPQLLNSTLLRVPDGQKGENGMTSRQIETSYYSDGLPRMRRLRPGINNQNGVNGESYIYDENKRLTTLNYLDPDGEPVCNKQGIMMVKFQYDDRDNLHSICYYSDSEGKNKTEGFNGVFCEKMEYDSYGNIIERKQLDRNENWWCDENGVYMYKYTYTDGALTQEVFLGIGKKPVRDSRYHSRVIKFEKQRSGLGKELSISLDPIGTPTAETDTFEEERDDFEEERDIYAGENENTITIQTNGQEETQENKQKWDKKLTQRRNTDEEETEEIEYVRKYTSIHYEVSPGNKIVKKSYYDQNDNLVANEEGYAIEKLHYDQERHLISELYLDTKSNPCHLSGGYAEERNVYGFNREIIRTEYRDKNGRLTVNREKGYAYVCFRHSEENQGKKETKLYYNESNELVLLPDTGYAISERYYDERGFVTRDAYYDESKKSISRSDYRVARIEYEYADDGNLICMWYQDEKGRPVNRYDTGYAAVFQEFEAGHLQTKYYQGYRDGELTAVLDKETGVARIVYTYDNNRLQREEYFDTEEKPILRSDTGCAIQEYEYDETGKCSEKHFYGMDKKPILRKDTGYAAVKFKYDEFGQMTDSRYYGTEGKPVLSTKYHCAGYEYAFDENGNQTDTWYIGLDGNPMVRRDLGYAHIKSKYDGLGNEILVKYFDEEEQPVVHKERGYACEEKEFEKGKLTEACYYDAQNELVLRKDKGYAIVRYEYDEYGQTISEHYYDIEDEPVISTEYHCAGFKYKYDGKGNRTDIWYLGLKEDDKIVRKDLGYAHVKIYYNEDGKETKGEYYDNVGQPAIKKEGGYASYENFYEKGNWVESRYYDEKGNLILCNDTGYAVIRNRYDEYNRRTSIRYYGTDGKLIIGTKYQCAGFDYRYNEKGNNERSTFIGVDNQPMCRRDLGYAYEEYEYDDLGNQIRVSYFGVGGEATIGKSGGYASRERKYEDGNLIEEWYYDLKGELIQSKELGYAGCKYGYDEFGQRNSIRYYGTDTKLVISSENHCAGYDYIYDERGNKVLNSFIGLDGNKMCRTDRGYAQEYWEYDDCGNEKKVGYRGVDDKPAVWKDGGFAYCNMIYENNRLIERDYYDVQGNLTLRKDTGYAIIKEEYDEYGQRISYRYYGTDGQPVISKSNYCAGLDFSYNERGYQTDTTYLGLDEKPMLQIELGYARVHLEYDHYGNEIKVSYYDMEASPSICKEKGYASREKIYEGGRLIEERFYGLDGKLVLRSDKGYAIHKYGYDEYGQHISSDFYGIGEKPVISTEYHCAGIRYDYNERGDKTHTRYTGLDGSLFYRSDLGYAHVQYEYDSQGNEIKVSYFNTKDNPTTEKEGGYASCIKEYENGKLSEIRYFDTKGKLVLRKDVGYAIYKVSYDDLGQVIAKSYYGTNEKPVMHTEDHCAGYEYEFDEKGNQTATRYIGTEGTPIIREDLGYAEVCSQYDSLGNEEYVSYLGTEGQPIARLEGGYASYTKKYANGNLVELRYFDTAGNVMVRNDTGYAICKKQYDEYGRCISEFYYDRDEGRVINTESYCSGLSYQFDERGNKTYIWYKGLDGENAEREDFGAALYFKVYDEYDRLIWEAYYNTDLKLVIRKDLGYAGIRREYAGIHVERLEYVGTDEKAISNDDVGYAVCVDGYNESGKWESEAYYDKDENLVNGKDGYAIKKFQYDSAGNYEKTVYYDQNEKEIEKE